jgi:hypothetical protein
MAAWLVFIFVASLPQLAQADFPLPGVVSANSSSGQFVVTATPEVSDLGPIFETDTNVDIVRLEPALLAVSADRVRESLLQKIGVDPSAPWGGKIFLALHPAKSLDENIEIFSSRFGNGWNYNVLLPDTLPRDRLARALTGVLILEYANRYAADRSAEVPPWLIQGLTQELLDGNFKQLILSTPDQAVRGMPMNVENVTDHGMDPLAHARAVFHDYPILTFTQLSWPTDDQLYGDDGGAYNASAQLFVNNLLGLRNGPGKMRTMLQLLPRYYNWQTAFWSAYHENFTTPLQVEKWWALQSVVFDSRSPGPQWNAATSRERLDEILSVAVDYRGSSNSLPVREEISLQGVIQNFNFARQMEILQIKLRDLELAQLRMAPSLGVLTAEYRNVLAEYLGQPLPPHGSRQLNKQAPIKISAREALRMLNALDTRRRNVTFAERYTIE